MRAGREILGSPDLMVPMELMALRAFAALVALGEKQALTDTIQCLLIWDRVMQGTSALMDWYICLSVITAICSEARRMPVKAPLEAL